MCLSMEGYMQGVLLVLILMLLMPGTRAAPAAKVAACALDEQVAAVIAEGYVAFVNIAPTIPNARPWPRDRMAAIGASYSRAIEQGLAGSAGFGSLAAWASAFGLSRVPAACPGSACCGAGGALRLAYAPNSIQTTAWYQLPDGNRVPVIQTGCASAGCSLDGVYHELAHVWDLRHGGTLGAQLDTAMGVVRDGAGRVDLDHYFGRQAAQASAAARAAPAQVHGDFATTYFNRMDPRLPAGVEHFAETVMAYFLLEQGDHYGFAACWTDEDPRCKPGQHYEYDRGDYIRRLISSTRS
jgi:hypothetical protein